ncbi:MAG: glutaredoxin family protein [Candidatus Paceibacterota bacterium]
MKKITIYSTPTCVYCKIAKDFFKAHDLTYTEKNVLADPASRKEAVDKSGQMGVPVIDIEGKIIVGFNEDQISKELGI